MPLPPEDLEEIEVAASPAPPIRRDMGVNPMVPSAPADAEPEPSALPTTRMPATPAFPTAPVMPTNAPRVTGSGRGRQVVKPTVQDQLAQSVVEQQRYAEQLTGYGDVLDRQDAAVAAAEEKRDIAEYNAQREATFRAKGIKHYKDDATGLLVPERDEAGRVRYTENTRPVEYDGQGRAVQRKRDETGAVTVKPLDANAKIAPAPDRPHELYRQNKHSAWEYIGTIDDGLKSDDPTVKSAAEKAQAKLAKDLHEAGGAALGTRASEATQKLQLGIADVRAKAAEIASLTQKLAEIDADPRIKETEGGFLSLGKQPTATAKELQRQRAELDAQKTELLNQGYSGDVARDIKERLNDARGAVTEANRDRAAWTAVAPTRGVDMDAAIEQRKTLLAANGVDPAGDPVLAAIKKRRQEIGIGGGSGKPNHISQSGEMVSPESGKAVQPTSQLPIFDGDDASRLLDPESMRLSPTLAVRASQPLPLTEEQAALARSAADKLQRGEAPTKEEFRTLYAATPREDRKQLAEISMQQAQQRYDESNGVRRGIAGEIGTAFARGVLQIPQLIFEVMGNIENVTRRGLEKSGVEEAAGSGLFTQLADAYQFMQQEMPRSANIKGIFEGGLKDPHWWSSSVAEFLPSILPGLGAMSVAQKLNLGSKEVKAARALVAAAESGKAAVGAEAMQTALATLRKFNTRVAFGSEFGMEYGSILGDLRHRAKEEGRGDLTATEQVLALGAGALAGAVGAYGDERFFEILRKRLGNAPAEAVDATTSGLLGAAQKIAARLPAWAQASGKAIAIEEAQELLQTSIEQIPKIPGWKPQDWDDFKEELATVAVTMPFVAGGPTVITHAMGKVLAGAETRRQAQELEARREVADAAIDNLQPSEAVAPEQIAPTQVALRALVKIANGAPVDSLTAAERAAVTSKSEADGLPRVEMVKGVPVITDGTLQRVAQIAPEVAALLPKDEASQRATALNPETAASGDQSQSRTSPALSGRTPERPSQADPAAPAERGQQSFAVEVENADGSTRTVTVPAATAEAAQAEVAGTLPAGAMVRGVEPVAADTTAERVPVTALRSGELRERVIEQLSRESKRPLTETEIARTDQILERFLPAAERWQAAFDGLKVTARAGGSMGGMLGVDDLTLTLSLPDIVRHAREFADPDGADTVVRHEAIHAVALALERQGKINVVATYRQMPAAVKAYVAGVYEPGRTDRSEFTDAHEFFRLMVEGHLAVKDGKLIDADGKVITEQLSPGFIAKIRADLVKLLQVFRDLARSLREQGAAEETINEAIATRDLIVQRIKEIDGRGGAASETASNGTAATRPDNQAGARGETERGGGESAVGRAVPSGGNTGPAGTARSGGGDAAAAAGSETGGELDESGANGLGAGDTRAIPSGSAVDIGQNQERRGTGSVAGLPASVSAAAAVSVAQEEIPGGAIGNRTRLTQNGRTVEVVYVAQDASEARPSHDALGNPTPGYDQALQPRDRSLPQYRKQSQNIATNLDFAQAAFFPETDTPATTADLGAPVMTRDGDTIIGNGREIGILAAYRTNSPASRRYKADFVRNAAKFGIDPAAVMRMAQPVLKRVIVSELSKPELVRFSQESNAGPAMASNALETAAQDATRITPQLLSLLDPNYAIDAQQNRPFVTAYVRDVVRSEGANEANVTPSDLTRRIRTAIFAHAYGMDETGRAAIERLAGDEADAGGKTITGGLLTVAPLVARLRSDIATGDVHGLDLAPALGRAAQDISEALRNRPAKQSAGDALANITDQGELLSEGNALTRSVRNFLIDNRTNRARIEQAVSNFVEGVYRLGNPKQADMFGAAEPADAGTIWSNAIRPEALDRTRERQVAAQRLELDVLRSQTLTAGTQRIVSAAVRAPDGRIASGFSHFEALEQLFNAARFALNDPAITNGFLTNSGNFLTRDEAYALARVSSSEDLRSQPVAAADLAEDIGQDDELTAAARADLRRLAAAAGRALRPDFREAVEVDAKNGYPGLPGFFPSAGLTREERTIEAHFAQMIAADRAGMLAKYEQLAEADFGTRRYINADLARDLYPAYRANPRFRLFLERATIAPAGYVALGMEFSATLRDAATNPDAARPYAMFMAGGMASGKTTSVGKALPTLKEESALVYDSVFHNYDRARATLEQTIAAGLRPVVVFVYRPFEQASDGAIYRTITTGRPVRMAQQGGAHFDAQQVFFRLQETFGGQADFKVIFNDGALKDIREEPVDALRAGAYENSDETSRENLGRRYGRQINEAHAAGRLDSAQYQALRSGSAADPRLRSETRSGQSGLPGKARGQAPTGAVALPGARPMRLPTVRQMTDRQIEAELNSLGYEIQRDMPGEGFELLRDGEPVGEADSIRGQELAEELHLRENEERPRNAPPIEYRDDSRVLAPPTYEVGGSTALALRSQQTLDLFSDYAATLPAAAKASRPALKRQVRKDVPVLANDDAALGELFAIAQQPPRRAQRDDTSESPQQGTAPAAVPAGDDASGTPASNQAGNAGAQPAPADAGAAADTGAPQDWFDNELTSAGRARILERLKIKAPARILWQHLAPENQNTLSAEFRRLNGEQADGRDTGSTGPGAVDGVAEPSADTGQVSAPGGGAIRGPAGDAAGAGGAGTPGSRGGGEVGAVDAGGTRDTAGSGSDDVRSEPDGRPAGTSDAPQRSVAKPLPAREEDRNHVIEAGDTLAPRGNAAKYQANIGAIRLLRTLESEGRNPTAAEKKQLAQYTGWGWAGEYFNPDKPAYARQYAELKELLSPEEFDSARASTTNAHYTAPEVITAMWDMVRRLGFNGGTVLEPAGGVGHYFGLMPQDVARMSDLRGVELDSLSGRIFGKLYPEAEVQVTGFQSARIPNNSVDLAISNVPFGDYKVPGAKDYPNLFIHDYFFARSLDKVRPGGLVAFITSDGTMDKGDKRVRELLATKADLVASIRLPNNAFQENAGTEVTTDIILLRKKDESAFTGEQWTRLATVGTAMVTGENGREQRDLRVNEYYAKHPENALGEHSLAGTMYGGDDYALTARPGQDTEALLRGAVARLPENVITEGSTAPAEIGGELAAEGEREGSVQRDEAGNFFQIIEGRREPAPWLFTKGYGKDFEAAITPQERVNREAIARDWLALREATLNLIRAENQTSADRSELTVLRSALNTAYDRFRRNHSSGKTIATLNKRPGQQHNEKARFLEDDPEYPLLQALERERKEIDPKTGKDVYHYEKSDIFTKRIRSPKEMPESAKDAPEAVAISLGYTGKINPDVVARLLGVSRGEAIDRVVESGRGFRDPQNGQLITRERYLSGNVRAKLKAAEQAESETQAGEFVPNIEALRAAQPARIPLSGIYYNLGSRWMPAEAYSKFASEILGTPATVEYSKALNSYIVTLANNETPANTTTWATKDFRGRDILVHGLNLTEPEVRVNIGTSSEPRMVRDDKRTEAARSQLKKMRAQFQSWLKTTTETTADGKALQEHVEDVYNDVNNALVAPQYSGDYLVLPGMSDTVRRLPHRLSVVARILQEGAAVMAHGVGSGKTFSQIVAAMEMRRLGLAKKPMIVVQKSTIGQFASSFREAYPDAKILVANEKSFEKANRRRFMARIATGDYDAVIVTHPQFDRLPNTEETVKNYFQERIDALVEAIRERKARGESSRDATVKQIEKAKRRLEAKMTKRLDGLKSRQDFLPFENLGVDALLIDEAHAYKKVSIQTNMRNVRGIPNDESQRAMGLEMKTAQIQAQNNGRNVILATGTPITNTMAEAYVMLKLATPHVLREYGIDNFDEFASTFGQAQTKLEYSWGGKWKLATRFNKFVNGAELITMIRSGFDVKMGNKELGLKVPKQKGTDGADAPELVIVPQTGTMENISDWITRIADKYEKTTDKREVSHIPIVTMQAGMAAALDPRLVDPALPDEPGSKVNHAIGRVLEIYRETAGKRGVQAIFADRFKPMNVGGLSSFLGGGVDRVAVEDTPESDEAATETPESAESELSALETEEYKAGGFNLYHDIRDKLIKGGVPAAEIAIIHDFNTDKRREKLFEDLNSGRVRIVLGSTEKLGVGVNMQNLLVAMHHMDPPRMMTPAMMEQRDGRGVRQGNTNAEIWNIRYGTEKSMDTGIYQMLENKGRFIVQALTAKGVGRTFEDAADEATLSMAEMKALLTGDQRVLRKAELEQELSQLEVDKAGFEDEQSSRARRLASERGYQRLATERQIPRTRADIAALKESFNSENPSSPWGTDRKEIAEGIDAMMRKQGVTVAKKGKFSDAESEMVRIGGVPIRVTARTLKDAQAPDYKLTIYSPTEPGTTLRDTQLNSGQGALASIGAFVRNLPGVLTELETDSAARVKQIAELERSMGDKWTQQEAYDAKRAELTKIEDSLLGKEEEATADAEPAPTEPATDFAEGERLIYRSPATGEETSVLFDAVMEDGRPVVFDDARGRTMSVPLDSLRRPDAPATLNAQRLDPDENPELDFTKAADDAEKSAHARFTEALPLAMRIANSYANIPGVDMDEVRQTARVALVKAARVYDGSRGVPFAGLARVSVNNALRGLYRGESRRAAHEGGSLDADVNAESGNPETLKDRVAGASDVRGDVVAAESRALLNDSIRELPERMQRAIEGVLAGESLETIGEGLGGISRQAVGRLATEAMRRLRGKLGERGVRSVSDLMAQRTDGNVSSVPDENQAARAEQKGTSPQSSQEASALLKAFETGKEIPADWYIHGRSTRAEFSALGMVFATKDVNVADYYAGKNGSLWAVREPQGTLDMGNPEHRSRIIDSLKEDYEQGILPGGLDRTISPEGETPDAERWEKIESELNPSDLVESGALFDDHDFTYWLWDRLEVPAVRVERNGLILLDGSTAEAIRLPSNERRAPVIGAHRTLDAIQAAVDTALKTQEATDDPIAELMALLDSDAITALQDRAAGEASGSRTIGRPDLSLGAEGPAIMGVDAQRASTATRETIDDWTAEGEAMLDRDYEGTARNLAARAIAGGTLNPAETRAAQLIVAREMAAPLTPESRRRVQALVWAYRQTGTEAGRQLASRRDPFKTPEERNREFLAKAIFTPPAKVRAQLETATPTERESLLRKDQDRISRIEAELGKMGVSFDDILSGGTRLTLVAAPIVNNIIATFDEKRQRAFKLMQGGERSYTEIAKMVGLGEKEMRAVKAEFIAALREKHFEKFRRGLKADQVEAEPTLLAQPTVSDAEAEAEFQKALRKMGIVSDAEQGQMKRARRKTPKAKLFRPPSVPYSGPVPDDSPVPFEERRQNQLAFKPGDEMRNVNPKPGESIVEPTGRVLGQVGLPLYQEYIVRKGADVGSVDDVVKIARVAQAANGNAFDMIYEYWINGILSGPQTQVANISGNTLNSALDMTLQRGMETLVNLVYRDANAAQLGEFKHLLRGVVPGFQRGLALAVRAWSAEADFFRQSVLGEQVEMFEDFDKAGGRGPSISGKTGRVVRMPGRALLFFDSLFKGLVGQMEAGAQAYRIAKSEGLKGEAIEKRIRALVATPNSLAWQRAVEKATELTFQEEIRTTERGGGPIENAVARFNQMRSGSKLIGFFFPFVRTPYNIFRIALRKTPLGSTNMLVRLAQSGFYRIKDGKPVFDSYSQATQVKHLAEQMIAWTTFALFYGAAQGDDDDDKKRLLFTGSMPFTETKRGERELNQRAFGGTYQIRIGGRDGVTFNYGRYEPIATVLGTMVDTIRQIKKGGSASDRMDAMLGYFVAQAQEKTFLQGFADISKTMQESQSWGEGARKALFNAIVPNFVRQPLRNLDDFQRNTKDASALYQMFPVDSLAEPKIDLYGQPVRKGGNPLSRLFFSTGTAVPPELTQADQLLLRWQQQHPEASGDTSVPAGPVNRGMTAPEFRRYSEESGRLTAVFLRGKITPAMIARPTEDDVKMIKKAIEDARKTAKPPKTAAERLAGAR